MYTIKGYIDILLMWLNVVPFATNETYAHDHRWKHKMNKSSIANVVVT
jgi:hypothetical protein